MSTWEIHRLERENKELKERKCSECGGSGWLNDGLLEQNQTLYSTNLRLKEEVAALKHCDETGYDRFEAGKSFANRMHKLKESAN